MTNEEINWQRIKHVHSAAKSAGVSYSLHYSEADNSWCFSIRSSAPSEEWQGKNHSFDIAVDCVLEWLEKLG